MRLAAHARTLQVNPVRHVIEGIHIRHLNHMRLVMSEIIVLQNSRLYGLKICSVFELDIYHTAMHTGS